MHLISIRMPQSCCILIGDCFPINVQIIRAGDVIKELFDGTAKGGHQKEKMRRMKGAIMRAMHKDCFNKVDDFVFHIYSYSSCLAAVFVQDPI